MRDGWKSRWGWRISAVVLLGGLLVVGTGTVVTQAGERDDDHHKRNPFERILHKLDKILDALKGGGGQEGNHTLRWDQNLAAGERFVILPAFNNEAALDKNTGLVWEKSPEGVALPWDNARFGCINKNVGGQKGWRLPSIPELASLIDSSVAAPGPTLPVGHPFIGIQSDNYWSASADPNSSIVAWNVYFYNGDAFTSTKTFSFQYWCVRGGMNADAY